MDNLMNKKLWIIFAILAFSVSVQAETRSADEALAIAEAKWMSAMAPGRGGEPMPTREMRLSETRMMRDGVTPAYYIFNRGEQEGWVIVSAETAMQEVLAYGESGSMQFDATRSNVAWWLERYAAHAEAIHANPALAHTAAGTTYHPVTPLIGTTWSQDDPYDLYCPSLSGYRCPTGCVATAVGQIMYKYKHPQQGQGSHQYYWRNGGQRLSVDFSQATYDWGHMTKTYNRSSSQQSKEAVATLLYHVGVSCDMDYDPNGSGAQGDDVMNALVTYFGYEDHWIKHDLEDGYFQDGYSLDQMMAFIDSELQAGRPLFVTGYSASGDNYWQLYQSLSGHAFVCEGIRSDGYLYINWGWGGVSDGYFALDNLNPDTQGIGGSDGAYQYMVTFYGGIEGGGSHITPDFNFTAAKVVDSSSAEPGKISLTLQTADYTGLKKDTTGTALHLSLYNRDAASLYGSWVCDNSALQGTCKADECYLNYGGNRYSEPIESGLVTIQPDNGNYTVYLAVQTSRRAIVDTLSLAGAAVTAKLSNGKSYPLTNQAPTWANFDQLVNYAETNLTRTENSPIPVFAQGAVTRLIYTAAQVAGTGLHRFFVGSLTPSSAYTMAIKDVTYLRGENWTAERYDSVQLGDTVVVLGPIRKYNANQPIIEYGTLIEIPYHPTTAIILHEADAVEVRKVIRNGRLWILRGEDSYSILGQKKSH